MNLYTIALSAGSSTENLEALAEVRDFAVATDTGWTYRVLPEPFLTAELGRLSNVQSGECADSITFQPCPYFNNQDRRVIETWVMRGGEWTFAAILDGTTTSLLHSLRMLIS